MGWQRGSIVGTGIVEDGQYGKIIKVQGNGRQATIYIGDKYEGDVPPTGLYAEWNYSESDPKPGRKYGSKYLNGYDTRTEAIGSPQTPQNGTGAVGAPRKRDPKHEALIVAQNIYNRATDLACANVIKREDIQGMAEAMVLELREVWGKVHEMLQAEETWVS